MKKIIKHISFILLFLSLISVQQLTGQTITATGIVYADKNQNNKLDKGEKGVPEVAVSNGSEVTLTDKDGKYSLEVNEKDAMIFVIKPSDYNYPLNSKNLPQFYYLHKPNGSPKLKFPGVAPTGKLPASVDFALIPATFTENFNVLVFSDPQPYSTDEINFYDQTFVEELKDSEDQFAFGMTLGDLTGDRPDFFEPLNIATARIGLPWYNVMGNHDMNYDASTHEESDESFENAYGPSTYAFNHGKAHFIILDDVYYPNDFDNNRYTGGLTETQFKFIEHDLQFVPEDYLVVLSMHIPLFNEAPHGETFRNDHRQRLFDLIGKHRHTFSMSGHTHVQQQYFFDGKEGWPGDEPHHHYNVGTVSGDWWSGELDENGVPDATMRDGSPNGFVVLSFNGNKLTYDYQAQGMGKDYKMRIYGPKLVPHNSRFRGDFYVNYFEGSEFCKVECRFDDGDWTTMNYAVEQDPYVSAIRCKWDHAEVLPTGIRPSSPGYNYHLWKTRALTKLPVGQHEFQVKITDRQGRVHNDKMNFEIVKTE